MCQSPNKKNKKGRTKIRAVAKYIPKQSEKENMGNSPYVFKRAKRSTEKMNSRAENGKMSIPTQEEIIQSIKEWEKDGEIEIDEEEDNYISYFAHDDWGVYSRTVFFPETDSLSRIRESMIYDDEVKDYLNIDAVAEFIYKYIDVNALCCIKGIALFYDKDDCKDNESKGRYDLMSLTDGDEYAVEICLDALGINWVDQSIVVLNISNLLKSTEEICKDVYGEDWEYYFDTEFQRGIVQTICHEFRHTIYDINEITEKDGSDPRYPANGGLEDNVEDYGNEEAERLLADRGARQLINKMFIPENKTIKKNKTERDKD